MYEIGGYSVRQLLDVVTGDYAVTGNYRLHVSLYCGACDAKKILGWAFGVKF